MIKFDALDLIPTVAALRAEALLSRDACKTDFARGLHDTLAKQLDAVIADLHDEVERERRFLAERGTQDGDECYEIYHICTLFEHRWVENGPFSVLDAIYEDVVFEGETCRVGLDYAIVPDTQLEGLADVLDRIRRQTGIEFIAARVAAG